MLIVIIIIIIIIMSFIFTVSDKNCIPAAISALLSTGFGKFLTKF